MVFELGEAINAETILKALQESNGLAERKLIKDVPTRWNSTYYMLQSVWQSKAAVVDYAANNATIPTLTGSCWGIVEKTISVLAPLEKMTKVGL